MSYSALGNQDVEAQSPLHSATELDSKDDVWSAETTWDTGTGTGKGTGTGTGTGVGGESRVVSKGGSKGGESGKGEGEAGEGECDELFGLEEGGSLSGFLLVITKQSFPVIVSFFLGLGGTFINLLFAGRFVPVEHEGDRSVIFAGVSLANMFVSVSCLSLLIGMSSAVETLGSQHNGAGNYKEVGLVLQRSFAVLACMCVPILCLWAFVAPLYRLLGVEAAVCEVVRRYIFIRAFSVPLDVANESYEKYLMSIGVVAPSMWANIVFNLLVLSFNCLFCIHLRLPYDWLAVSWVLSSYLAFALMLLLSYQYAPVKRTLVPWDLRAFTRWGEFCSLGLPGTVMLCSEWWAFEFLTIFASLLGTANLAAQTIIMQIASMSFMIPLGIGITCASLVGNAMGAGRPKLAVQIGRSCLLYTSGVDVLVGCVIYMGGAEFVKVFTSDPQVQEVAASAVPFLALFIMIDGLQGVASGVLRGAGRQVLGACANVVAYYALGLPVSWILCFRVGFGVDGLIMGVACGSLFQVCVLFVLIFGFEKYLFSGGVEGVKAGFAALGGEEGEEEFGSSRHQLVRKGGYEEEGSGEYKGSEYGGSGEYGGYKGEGEGDDSGVAMVSLNPLRAPLESRDQFSGIDVSVVESESESGSGKLGITHTLSSESFDAFRNSTD